MPTSDGGSIKSITGELEELESLLSDWRRENNDTLQNQPWPASPTTNEICVFVIQTTMTISYE
jgi:hypothetical protein